jgi:hypothetical protein
MEQEADHSAGNQHQQDNTILLGLSSLIGLHHDTLVHQLQIPPIL